MCLLSSKFGIKNIQITGNTCIAEPREPRWGGGGGGDAQKMSGMKWGENWSKLCSLGGRVSMLAFRAKRVYNLVTRESIIERSRANRFQ